MNQALLEQLVREAIRICQTGINAGQSPFGAVVARPDGEIVATAHNTVRATCDATAHAEINVLRRACHELGTIDLADHILASTCEPCPMCAAAIHWANIGTLVYGASIEDAASAGFRELPLPCAEIYARGESAIRIVPGVAAQQCAALFEAWSQGPFPNPY
jgi:tRNA(Arg) A34 adenosine deaminase TadA